MISCAERLQPGTHTMVSVSGVYHHRIIGAVRQWHAGLFEDIAHELHATHAYRAHLVAIATATYGIVGKWVGRNRRG